MNGKVLDFDFNSDGSRLFSCGNDGEVYIWDLNRRQCLKKFADEGALIGTSIAASKNGQYLACGLAFTFHQLSYTLPKRYYFFLHFTY